MQSLFSDTSTPASVFGTGAANGRQGTVLTQANRAYEAGRTAPHAGYDDTVWRAVDTFDPKTGQPTRWEGYADHRWGDMNGGRYHDPGSRLIYTSPSKTESLGELAAYPNEDGSHPMKNKTMVEMRYDAQGKMADVSGHLDERGIRRSAVTAQKGKLGPDRLHRLTGEDPYLYARAMGQGAMDSGASSMKVPSATGGNQIDIIPANTDPRQLQYQAHTHYDADGQAGARVENPLHKAQHGPGSMGIGAMPRGDAAPPGGHKVWSDPNYATGSKGATTRAGNADYSKVGAGVMAGATNLMAWMSGQKSGEEAILSTVGETGVGVGSAMAQDALTTRLGGTPKAGFKAGAIVDAITSGAFSTWDNADAYKRGDVNASQATANVLVDTGIGVGSGLAGAAAGAAIGSVIPVAGTAVGALVGFGAGMLGSWAANKLAYGTGFADWAKEGLGGVLAPANEHLTGAWDGISAGQDWISNKAGEAWGGIKDGAGAMWEGAQDLGGQAWDALSGW